MWQALTQMYGSAFVSAYGEQPPTLWSHAIGKLSAEHIKRGLERLSKEPREYPVNLTQFLGACNHKEPVRYLGVPMTALEWDRSLAGKASREVAKKYIDKIRARLK